MRFRKALPTEQLWPKARPLYECTNINGLDKVCSEMGEEKLSATVLFRYAKGQAGYSLAAETGVAANGNGAINNLDVS